MWRLVVVLVMLAGCESAAPYEPPPERVIDPICKVRCVQLGKCTFSPNSSRWDTQCMVASDADCAMSDLCKNEGKCWRDHDVPLPSVCTDTND
jgi:hypothetical protein